MSLEAGLRSVEIASRLLLLHDSFILLSEDKAGLLEKHVGWFWCLCLRLGNAVYEAREVNLLWLLGLQWGNILDEALLDLRTKTANQDWESALHCSRAWSFHLVENITICASTALAACMSKQGQLFLILTKITSLFEDGRLSLDKPMLRSFWNILIAEFLVEFGSECGARTLS